MDRQSIKLAESRFWDKYIAKTKDYNVHDNAVRWYVLRVEEYIKAFPSLKLACHTANELDS